MEEKMGINIKESRIKYQVSRAKNQKLIAKSQKLNIYCNYNENLYYRR